MADARARGSKAEYLIGLESVYGTAPDGSGDGVYYKLIMSALDFGKSRTLDSDAIWNGPAEETGDPVQGAIDVSGSMTIPACSRSIGLALKLALGAPDTVDNTGGSWTHTFKSTLQPLSFAAQQGHPALSTPSWRTGLGVLVGGFSFDMSRSGRTSLQLPLLAQSEVKDVAGARDADPITYAYRPFDNATGSIKIGGVQVASVTGGNLEFSNSLEGVEVIRADGALDGIDPGERKVSGSLEARLGASTAISDLADADTPGALEYGFALKSDPTVNLKIQMPRTFFSVARSPINGPGGVSQSYTWSSARDAVAGYMMAAVLTNDVESY